MFHFSRKRNRENVSVTLSGGTIRTILIFIITIVCLAWKGPEYLPGLLQQLIELASAVKRQ